MIGDQLTYLEAPPFTRLDLVISLEIYLQLLQSRLKYKTITQSRWKSYKKVVVKWEAIFKVDGGHKKKLYISSWYTRKTLYSK